MNKVGILGGTFNPIHIGHVKLAEAAYRQFNLSHIYVMPSGQPSSYKDINIIADADDRCAMIELAIKDFPYMSLSRLEVERCGATYTSDTLKELKQNEYDIYFIIGADSLLMLDKWHEAEYVMKNCTFLAANRNHHKSDELRARIEYLKKNFDADIKLIELDDIPLSSSDIRSKAASGCDISYAVGDEVYKYIKEHGLYR